MSSLEVFNAPSFRPQPKPTCQQLVLLEHGKLQKCQRDLKKALAVAASCEKTAAACEAEVKVARAHLTTRGAVLAERVEKLDELQEDFDFYQASKRKLE